MAKQHITNIITIALTVLVGLLGIPNNALSQGEATPEEGALKEAASKEAAPKEAAPKEAASEETAPEDPQTEASQNPEVDRKLAEMEKRLQEMDKKLEAEIKRNETKAAENIEDDFDLSAEDYDIEATGEFDTTKLLSLYGFFDVEFVKHFQADDSLSNLSIPAKSSFLISNITLFLLSQPTETLSALLELRFSFLPHGQEKEIETAIYVDGQQVPVEGKYVRVDTTVTDPFNSLMFKQGGVSIERVHLTYAPFEWLKILVGRYLTPYGIWNIDHGSPIVLPIQLPFMQMREMVPLAQTGIQVMGRFFVASDTVVFDYAVTLSNGRGDLDAIYDVNENKAVGLRLKLSYEGEKLKLSAGGYGYYGVTTDIEKVMVMHMNSDMTLDESLDRPMRVLVNDIGSWDDYILSADFLLEFAGVKLQSEYIWNRKSMQKHAIEPPDWTVVKGISASDTVYYASSVGNAVYVLLGYELPLHEWIAPVLLTPYVMYEYTEYADTAPHGNIDFYRGGLNVKPSQYVVLKAEFAYGVPHHKIYAENNKSLLVQMAVSF